MGYSRLNDVRYVHALVPKTCDGYSTRQKELLEVIKLRIFKLGDYPRLSGWPDIITSVHVTGAQEESQRRK